MQKDSQSDPSEDNINSKRSPSDESNAGGVATKKRIRSGAIFELLSASFGLPAGFLVSLNKTFTLPAIICLFLSLVFLALGFAIDFQRYQGKKRMARAIVFAIIVPAFLLCASLGTWHIKRPADVEDLTYKVTTNINRVVTNIEAQTRTFAAERTSSVPPEIYCPFRIMPFDPPYPENTVIAGIHFEPQTLDVRLSIETSRAPVKNLDLMIRLINTTGQLLAILDMRQKTEFPGISIFPIRHRPGDGVDSIRVNANGSRFATIPLDSKTSLGSMQGFSDTWRIHASDILEGARVELVLMIDRPYRTKMIEGFMMDGTVDLVTNGVTIAAHISNTTLFDDAGVPRQASESELAGIRKFYSARENTSGRPANPPPPPPPAFLQK